MRFGGNLGENPLRMHCMPGKGKRNNWCDSSHPTYFLEKTLKGVKFREYIIKSNREWSYPRKKETINYY
jgi:hypothetical protein